jgi:hypothetical protein
MRCTNGRNIPAIPSGARMITRSYASDPIFIAYHESILDSNPVSFQKRIDNVMYN